MLLDDVADASARVAATRSRLAKRAVLVDVLRRAAADGPDAVAVVSRYLGGELRQRRTGLGWRSLTGMPGPAAAPSLTVEEVDAAFAHMAGPVRVGLLDRPPRGGACALRGRDRARAAPAARAGQR